jgi:addiction module RelE/StbE family toxin
MAREVNWTDPAWNDLVDIADYIAKDSQYYAATFVQEVKDASASLDEFAERGQIVPEWGDPSVRELLIKSYRLIYQISPQRVVILALIHGARRERRF